jgi:hypothetical protein
MIFGPLWPTWWGRRTPVSAGEGRTVAELLDDSDGLAREALLDMSADREPGMVGGWPQLMQSAAQLWAVLSSDSTVSASADPDRHIGSDGQGRRPRPRRRTLAWARAER